MKYKNRIILSLIAILFMQEMTAQSNFSNSIDSNQVKQVDHKKTVYHIIQQSFIANKETSYLATLPIVSSIGDRRIPLRNGESSSGDLYLVEANLNLIFPLFFGREDGSHSSRRNRINFDYNGTFRMTLDNSKPLTPGSNKVGFSWYSNLYNNYTGWLGSSDQTSENEILDSKSDNLKFVNMVLRAHHYSNGQPPGFYYTPDEDDPSSFRNSYLDGDFSTNYFYLEFSKGLYNKGTSVLRQWSFAYRFDFGDDSSVLAYSQEQEETYGRHRLYFLYDYRTNRDETKKVDYHFRAKLNYIMDNLDKFNANLINDSNDYRLGFSSLFELAPKNHRSIGYFISFYYGRDYLNVRYDDIIYSIQYGITLSLNKFKI